jgi:hypothetical protein
MLRGNRLTVRITFALLLSGLLPSVSAFALVGGSAIDDQKVEGTFDIHLEGNRSIDTPEIPVGPNVAITCGHCSQGEGFVPDQMKAGQNETDTLYDALTSGTYGLPFFEKASYPYDLSLVQGDFAGPYVSIGEARVQLGETLVILGKGKDTSAPGSLCDGYSLNHHFDHGDFKVVDFYTQGVGFIVTGQDVQPGGGTAVTCYGDSGSYYFRVRADKTVELVGINSWGTEGGETENPQDGVNILLQGYLSGAGDLTSPGIRAWLTSAAEKNGLKICGINLTCPAVTSPF